MLTLHVVRRMVVLNVMETLEYRGAFFVFMVNTVATPLVSLLVWLTVSEQGVSLPYNRSQFVTYYVLLGVVAMLTGTWGASFLADDIRLGSLSRWLLRPSPFIASWIGNNVGEKVIKLPLILPLVGLVALAFRADLRLPVDPVSLEMSQYFWYLDSAKAEADLGWQARDPMTTLSETIEDLRARGVVWPEA